MAIKVGEKDLFPYLGDYGPVSIYKGEQKLAGYKWAEKSGQELHFDNTYNSHVEVEVDGQSYQHTAPTPDYPIEIESLNDFDVVSSTEKLTEGQLQEYDYGVEYENVDKINLSLSEPLRSVGDVKDRLFRDDSDGLWKVERNVGEITLDGSRGYNTKVNSNPEYSSYYYTDNDIAVMAKLASSHYPFFEHSGAYASREGQQIRNYSDTSASIMITDYTMTYSEFQNKLRDSPVAIVYEKRSSELETLDQELQDKLNTLKSFKDSNYVYTVLQDDDLTPTIHAKTEVKDI